MGLLSFGFLLALLCATECAVISRNETESCRDFGLAFERVFAVPGEAVALDCPLTMEFLFDPAETSFNTSWFRESEASEISAVEKSIVLKHTTLWILNVTLQHRGQYTCLIRTASECFRQATLLVVSEMEISEHCKRPQSGSFTISAQVNDVLPCPLRGHMRVLESPSIHWYKNCEPIQQDEKFTLNKEMLYIREVQPDDAGFYTCRMSFRLDGVDAEMAVTIECVVEDKFSMKPQVREPNNELVKVEIGSSFRKDCVVIVPGEDVPLVVVIWKVSLDSQEELISQDVSHRIHQKPSNMSRTADGFVIVRSLLVNDISQQDLFLNFTCMASSSRGDPTGHLTLIPTGPNLLLSVALLLGSLASLFVISVFLCTAFKVELALWVRTAFPFLYQTTEGDGKQYDAYIAYPRVLEGSSAEAEVFAMSTLPQVLEGKYGYKLFILGRDGLPGEAVVDVVEEAMSCCRRLLLLYSSSSLLGPEAQMWLEQQTGLHQALVQDSLSIVLLELQEIRSPQRLPESIQLLKHKQGALQAWRRSRWRWRASRDRRCEDETLQPSERFWRELRYHMPVRGKAKNSWFRF